MDKETLLKLGLPEADVELPSGAGTIRVRGLSRLEAIGMNTLKTDEEREVHALACAMLDPIMTQEDVRAWQRAAVAADVQAASIAVGRLSNMEEGSGKAATKSVPVRRSRRG